MILPRFSGYPCHSTGPARQLGSRALRGVAGFPYIFPANRENRHRFSLAKNGRLEGGACAVKQPITGFLGLSDCVHVSGIFLGVDERAVNVAGGVSRQIELEECSLQRVRLAEFSRSQGSPCPHPALHTQDQRQGRARHRDQALYGGRNQLGSVGTAAMR